MAVFTRDVVGSEYFDKDTQDNNDVNDDTYDSNDVNNDTDVSNSLHSTHNGTKYDVEKVNDDTVINDAANVNAKHADSSDDDNEDTDCHELNEEQAEMLAAKENEAVVMEATSKLITWKDKIDAMSKTAFAMRIVGILYDSIHLLPNTTSSNMCCNPYGQSVKQKLSDIKCMVQNNDDVCVDRVISTYVNYVQHFDTSVPDSSVYLFFGGVATVIGFLYNVHTSQYDFDKMMCKRTFMNPVTFICALVAALCSGVAFMDISCKHDVAQSKLKLMYIPKMLGKQVYATHLRAKDAVSVIQAISNFIAADKEPADVSDHKQS